MHRPCTTPAPHHASRPPHARDTPAKSTTSASFAVRSSPSGATYGRDATTTLMSIAETNGRRPPARMFPVPTGREWRW
ncbi:MAG TPA: hypothetical protein VH141_34200, partial [Pseudonocardia sp.]|nr:hypothetical protein [Pseudonocardia sp.]